MFLQEECCYYINESGVVEQNVQTLTKLSEELPPCLLKFIRSRIAEMSPSLGRALGTRVKSLCTNVHLEIARDPDPAGPTSGKPRWVGGHSLRSPGLAPGRGARPEVLVSIKPLRVAPLSGRGPSKVWELGACLLRHQAFQKPPLSRRLLKGLVHQRTGTQLHREKRKRVLVDCIQQPPDLGTPTGNNRLPPQLHRRKAIFGIFEFKQDAPGTQASFPRATAGTWDPGWLPPGRLQTPGTRLASIRPQLHV
ncbi:hypothetical protein QTO34_000899 [Cnephaeus nilssonii]|uniref:Uncharacterized protein n=1 Tax=Cnephaeus nilssonii TaxID=3371016 RepID=A0AA40ID73_CNENI|nr:hypothetical protein QTO34_000899 [Eptesicus nilssonii]